MGVPKTCIINLTILECKSMIMNRAELVSAHNKSNHIGM